MRPGPLIAGLGLALGLALAGWALLDDGDAPAAGPPAPAPPDPPATAPPPPAEVVPAPVAEDSAPSPAGAAAETSEFGQRVARFDVAELGADWMRELTWICRNVKGAREAEKARVHRILLNLLHSPGLHERNFAVHYLPEVGEVGMGTAEELLRNGGPRPEDRRRLAAFLASSDRLFEWPIAKDPAFWEEVVHAEDPAYFAPRTYEYLLRERPDLLRTAEYDFLWIFCQGACSTGFANLVLDFATEDGLPDRQRLAALKGLGEAEAYSVLEPALRGVLPRLETAGARSEALELTFCRPDVSRFRSWLEPFLRDRLAAEPNDWARLELAEWLDRVADD